MPDLSNLRAPAATDAREPASPRVSSSHTRAGWQWLKSVGRRLDDSWIGDLLGAVCVFATVYLLHVIAWAWS